jgi:hypothetical protein
VYRCSRRPLGGGEAGVLDVEPADDADDAPLGVAVVPIAGADDAFGAPALGAACFDVTVPPLLDAAVVAGAVAGTVTETVEPLPPPPPQPASSAATRARESAPAKPKRLSRNALI